jgi:uncharacterized RDD family membrane protein YckC
MDEGWWYAQGDDRQGPLSVAQIHALVRTGTIGAQTLVWRQGRLAWKPLHQVEELMLPGLRMEPVLLDFAPDAGRPAPALPEASLEARDAPHLDPWVPEDALQAPAPRRRDAGPPPAGPWRRFFARLFDIWTMAVPAGFFLGAVVGRIWPAFGLWMEAPSSTPALGILILPLALLFESVFVGLFGTTLGKLLFGVRVTLRDGARPTFLQYLGRAAWVYVSGLGLGIPFVTLFTMGRQFFAVKDGQAASYDAQRWRVSASGTGVLRTSVAALALAGLATGIVLLNQRETQRSVRYYAGFEWTNPVTTLRADIPRGWQYRQESNSTGDVIHTFFSDSVVAVFAVEGGVERMSLDEYQRIWTTAVRPAMALDARARPVNISGRLGLQMKGAMASDASRHVDVTLLKSGAQVWRVVMVGTSGRDPDTAATETLRNLLFQTVPAAAPEGAPRGSTV